jgi:prepilin-type N-terminal cleavage/methylation domain-containing protein
MKKSAFTMLELVFVIVVVGILAAVMLPRFERDNAGEAAYQVARHIRLAQQRAMVDDTFGQTGYPNNSYNIVFGTTTYTVQKGTVALEDSLTKKALSNVDMKKNFGVTGLNLTGPCSTNNLIAFDHLGQPYSTTDISSSGTPFSGNNCVISLTTDNGHTATITVYQETGYAKVTTIDGNNLP